MSAEEQHDDEERRLQLVHPVYLDVPMMISFLAALEGGIAFEDGSTRRTLTGAQRDREGGGKLRLPALGSLLGFDMSGRMGKQEREEDTEEVKAVRQHTSASLFNALHHRLHQDGYVRILREAGELNEAVGQLVQVTGAFIGNPLERVLAFFAQALPYAALSEEVEAAEAATEQPELPKNPGKSGSPAVRARASEIEQERQRAELARAAEEQAQDAFLGMLVQMRTDLAESAIRDAVLEGPDGLRAILTLSSEFFSETTGEQLSAGSFTVLGKVTRVLGEDEEVNLTRRTVLGAAGSQVAREVVVESVKKSGISLDTYDPIIRAPAVQVLPLAVFV